MKQDTRAEFLQKGDVAKRLGVSKQTLTRWTQKGYLKLNPVRIAGLTLYSMAEVETQMAALAQVKPNE